MRKAIKRFTNIQDFKVTPAQKSHLDSKPSTYAKC